MRGSLPRVPKGERTISAGDFFRGMMATALGADEILIAIEVPAKTAGQGMAYVKFTHPASRYAVIGAAVVVTLKGGSCTKAQVAIGGLLPVAARLAEVESAMVGSQPSTDAIAKAAGLATRHLGEDVIGDLFASADYRRAMAPVFVRRALSTAVERAS